MTCVSRIKKISVGPKTARNLPFWAETKSHADGIATFWVAKDGRNVLSTVFWKSSTLGRFACLRFPLNRTLYVLSRREKKRENDAFSQVCGSFQRGRNRQLLQTEDYPAPLLLCFDYVPLWVSSRVLCRRTRLRRPRVLPGRPTQLSTPSDGRIILPNTKKNRPSPCTLGRFPSAACHIALCFAGNSLSYLKTSAYMN